MLLTAFRRAFGRLGVDGPITKMNSFGVGSISWPFPRIFGPTHLFQKFKFAHQHEFAVNAAFVVQLAVACRFNVQVARITSSPQWAPVVPSSCRLGYPGQRVDKMHVLQPFHLPIVLPPARFSKHTIFQMLDKWSHGPGWFFCGWSSERNNFRIFSG